MVDDLERDSQYRLLPTDTSPDGLERLAALFEKSFGNTSLSADVLRWQYVENPCGSVVGYDAWSGSSLVAHYATVPIVATLMGSTVRGLLSINTATHPDHQKQGLFSALANKTYNRGRSLGFEFVVGVANDQSVHGFVNKLGFQSVGSVETRIVLSWVREEGSESEVDFERVWTAESAEWRLSHPRNAVKQYGHYRLRKGLAITGQTSRLPAIVGSLDERTLPAKANTRQWSWRPRLWLGIDMRTNWRRSVQLSVPARFRPIPLTLIFRDLVGNRCLRADRITFFSMDFDAY